MSYPLLHGQGHFPLTEIAPGQRLHPEAASAFSQMQQSARADGISLDIYSSFRSFATQQVIWDQKWRGQRPLFDDDEQPLNGSALNTRQRLYAILRWSALPGASRHHWGTDMDLFDAASLPSDTQLKLTGHEYAPGGHQHKLWCWLTQHGSAFGFFFPYAKDHGGVGVEPWHLSYAPLSHVFQDQLTLESLTACLLNSQIAGKKEVLEQIESIYDQYINGSKE